MDDNDVRGSNMLEAAAQKVAAARDVLPPGNETHAALTVHLRSETTVIDIPSHAAERYLTALGITPPTVIEEAAVLRDVVLSVIVNGEKMWTAPLTFLPADDVRNIRPALLLEENSVVQIQLRAWGPLPNRGVSFVLRAGILSPTQRVAT